MNLNNSPIKKMSSGVFYTAIAKYSGVILSIIIGAILARLLSPEEFGIVAIVTVFISFFNILSDMGLGPAIIQNKELNKKDIESIFFFSVILAFFFAIIFFFLAPFIASFYNTPNLISVVRLLSLTVLFYSLRVVPNALNLKKLNFKKVGWVTVSTQLLSGILAIILAYRGFSYYALVVKSIFDGLVSFILLYSLSPIRFSLKVNFEPIKGIAKFSTFQFFFNFVNYFSRNSDNLLIGRFLGPSYLGFYDKSYRLMMMPIQNLTHVITPVLHPILSNYQNDSENIYKSYLNVIKLLALIGFPLSVFLYYSANEIVTILYGTNWEESIPIFKILALSIGIQIVLSSTGSIFQASNRTDLLFYSGLISAIVMVSGICYGIFIGKSLVSIGYGLIIAFIINFFQGFYLLIKVALRCSFIAFLKVFIWPLISALILALLLSSLSFLSLKGFLLSLTLKIILSVICVVVVNLLSFEHRKVFFFLYQKLKRKIYHLRKGR